LLVAFVALTACQSVDDGADAPAAVGYPSLSTVPPRPQLSYPVQQRRAIVEGLIADLENARYTSQVLRYRTGQSNLPPPPEPPRIPAGVAEAIVGPDRPVPAEGVAAAPAAPGAVIDDAPPYFGDDDDASLSDFIRGMVRETAPPPAPGPPLPEAPPAPPAAEPGAPRAYLVPPEAPLRSGSDEPAVAPTVIAAARGAEVPVRQPDEDAPEPRAYVVPPEVPGTTGSDDASVAPRVMAAARPVDLPVPQPDMRNAEPAAGPPAAAMPIPQRRPEPPAALAALVPVPAPRPVPPEDAPAEVALVAPPAPTDPADQAAASPDETPQGQIQARLIGFAPGSADLALAVEPELARVLADAERVGLVIDIIGEAKDPALALERARAVALALIKLGAGTERLRIGADPEPSGDRAWIILADPL
jgi:hypothetical protein